MKKRKICVITGSRAEYGILVPVMKSIQSSKKLQLFLIATGMHLMREFGYTINEIKKDGFVISKKVAMTHTRDAGDAMVDALGKGVAAFGNVFNELKPDFVVVLGDRAEMLAAAIAANYMNIAVAHIHGGEISGHVDGVVRHAITKLAHIHFVATQDASRRVKKLGEEPWRIFRVGAPALDRLRNEILPDKKVLSEKYNISEKDPFIMVVQHPVSSEINKAGQQIKATLEAVKKLKMQTIIIYPNADAGGRRMIKIIKRYEKQPCFQSFKSISHKDYLGLLRFALVLVGNSSSGIIEAASFGLPVLNIGSRQKGRERSGNVIDVAPNQIAIARGLTKALSDKKFRKKAFSCKNIYGDGKAAGRIASTLGSLRVDERLLQKRMTF